MKIGIITIHKSPNYGACLQSYALYAFLKGQGFDCEIIDLLRPTHSGYIKSKVYLPYRGGKTGIIKKWKNILKKIIKKKDSRKILTKEAKHKFDLFNNKINYSQTYHGIDELYRNPPFYDVYISGSDQLWNPTIGFCIEPYFLTFVKKGRKISYATSIGVDNLLDNEKKDFSKWLSDYYSISVREKSGCDLLSPLISQEVTQVCDPTFLLEPNQWASLMIEPSVKEPYILLFTLNYNKLLLDFCIRLSKESKKKLIYLCLFQSSKQPSPNYIAANSAGPNEFIGYIARAEMVVTDSFHGTALSLLLEAGNFFVHIPSTQKRGKRITDMLDFYHLNNHVLNEDLNVSYQDLTLRSLDKNTIRDLIIKERKRSQEYLLRQLS